jgi:hypothetical protein
MNAAVGYVSALGQYGLDSILIRPRRQLGDIVAQVTLEETHHDELEITDHPVEQGAVISDHAFLRPSELTMKLGWSNSPSVTGLVAGVASGVRSTVQGVRDIAALAGVGSSVTGNSATQVRSVYDRLRQLQSLRVPFDVFTGKRTYKNMLIRSISVTTDKDNENSFVATLMLRQVITVSTQLLTLTAGALQQTIPQDTQGPTNNGIRQPAVSNDYRAPVRGGQ